jgi:ferredoxin--NADP+ reductase
MSGQGSEGQALRVAIVGSGPAAFYTVQALQKSPDLEVRVDMFERLTTPFGLVRFGVAPDHPKIKKVVAVYEKLARDPGFRFFGNVEYGRDIHLEDLQRHYHQVVFATGAQTDRRLGIPGEDLHRSHPATEFVAWYNGHPDFADHTFDLSQESAVVVGVGNVAVDVARILCRTPDELAQTDIADHALEALRHSKIRQVWLLGRRGPAQAAFTNPEAKELGELQDADTFTMPDEIELDPSSLQVVESDASISRKVDILRDFSTREATGKPKRLGLRFLVSPVEILDDGTGSVGAVRIVRNELVQSENGRVSPQATDRFETLSAGLVFRSVGYRGVSLPRIPFREDWGIVPNDKGRVLKSVDGPPRPGLYVSGWIKRGPSGVIGTNKPDAVETVACMIEDFANGRHFSPESSLDGVEHLLVERGAKVVSYSDWQRIDAHELETGKECGRPRLKMVRESAILDLLGSDRP